MGKRCLQLFVAFVLTVFAFGDTLKSSPRGGDFSVYDSEEYGDIERPCDIDDIYCIRRYFAAHGHCKIAKGPVPEVVRRGQSAMYLPVVNITAVLTNVDITGLNGRIEEFYVNKKTDNLLIAIEFQSLNFRSNKGFFKFNRRGREPIVASDEVNVFNRPKFGDGLFRMLTITAHPNLSAEHGQILWLHSAIYQTFTTKTAVTILLNKNGNIIVTVIIPNLKDLQLAKSEIFTYSNAPPPFTLGPGILLFPDPEVQLTIANFLAEFPIAVRESLLTDGNFYGSTYIQKNICDFGVIAN